MMKIRVNQISSSTILILKKRGNYGVIHTYAFEIPSLACEEEERFLVLGQINSKNYTAIITYRDVNIRIISVRKSREKEIKFYESIKAR